VAIPVLSRLTFGNGAGISGLPSAAAADEPVILSQLTNALNGLSWKEDVRAASTGNVNLAAPGATLDTVALGNGDRVLIKDNTVATENGIYIWTGAAAALTRSADAATFQDLEAAVVIVSNEPGASNANTRWRMTAVNGVLGTNNVTWISDQSSVPSASETSAGVAEIATDAEVAAASDDSRIVTPLKLKNSTFSHRAASSTIGDGTTSTFSITHSFGTFDVAVTVREATGARQAVMVETDTPDINTARVLFAAAPTANSYRVTVERLS
jgi:hypothetical protein